MRSLIKGHSDNLIDQYYRISLKDKRKVIRIIRNFTLFFFFFVITIKELEIKYYFISSEQAVKFGFLIHIVSIYLTSS